MWLLIFFPAVQNKNRSAVAGVTLHGVHCKQLVGTPWMQKYSAAWQATWKIFYA